MRFRFDDAPERIYWELTRACDLACTHCRASANAARNPRELRTLRSRHQRARRRVPADIIFTGGDPLKRRDFFEIVGHTVKPGLPCLVAPSATPLLTSEVWRPRVAAGRRDVAEPRWLHARHGTTACAASRARSTRTLQAARDIVEAGISLQINTLVTADTIADLPRDSRVVEESAPIGGASSFSYDRPWTDASSDHARARRHGDELGAGPAVATRPIVTTTEAPHYRRIELMRRAANRGAAHSGRSTMRGLGIRDGNGVMFISHTGEIQPSGFLPLTAGNVRRRCPADVSGFAHSFRDLRGPTVRGPLRHAAVPRHLRRIAGARLRGDGDPFQSDPLCSYVPTGAAAPTARA